jgi:hypothetical protein
MIGKCIRTGSGPRWDERNVLLVTLPVGITPETLAFCKNDLKNADRLGPRHA